MQRLTTKTIPSIMTAAKSSWGTRRVSTSANLEVVRVSPLMVVRLFDHPQMLVEVLTGS